MNEVKALKVMKKGYLNSKKFMELAEHIVKTDVTEIPGEPLTAAARKRIAEVMSIDMATGYALSNRKYLIGIAIGCGITFGVISLNKKMRKRA